MAGDETSPPQRRGHHGYNTPEVPQGYLQAQEAIALLGVGKPGFDKYKAKGLVVAEVPPGKRHGFYRRAEVEAFARQLWAADLAVVEAARGREREVPAQKTRVVQATRWDIDGINEVLASFGWPYTPRATREKWYEKNARLDWVVRYHSLILGYVNLMPYLPEWMEEVLSGRVRGWMVRPHMFAAYEEAGHTYDAFVGIAVRRVAHHQHYAARLISGLQTALFQLADRGIFFRRLYGMSDEEEMQRQASKLGFEAQPARPGDVILNEGSSSPGVRYLLDLETSPARWARRYRSHVRHVGAALHAGGNARTPPPLSLVPDLKGTLQTLLHVPHGDIARDSMIVGALRPLLARIALDPRLTDDERAFWVLLVRKLEDLQAID